MRDADSGDAADAVLRERLGPYRLLERIGEGGMGVVYLAERSAPMAQRAALKVIRAEKLDRSYRARFAFEQDVLARMDHPAVARLLDAGESDGRAWFAMEYVPGRPLTAYCREHRLGITARLRLFLAVCDGVHHAHMRGVLHRDLKPANVLVRELDGQPAPKVIDFGLALPTDPSRIRATLHEPLGQISGTVAYMSPEQALRAGEDLDVRADVYALGVMLYELLCGQLPVDVRVVEQAGLAALARLWEGPETAPPSARVRAAVPADAAAVAAERETTPRRLAAALRGDLDVVCATAIARDRQRRYASVRDFARDIGRVLDGKPIEARPPSLGYVLKAWCKRHRAAAAAAAVAAVAAVVVVAQTLAHARAQERLAQEREQLAQEALLANDALAAAGLLAARAGLRGDRGGAAAIDAWLAQAQPILGRAAVHRARAQGGAPASQAFVADALPQLDAAVVAAVRWRADLEWLAALESELAAPWARVRAEVRADPRYAGLDLPPQFGLRPLGRDPGSGLFEFQLVDPSRRALPPAAREIARGPDGALVMAADMDPVLVLLPGGAFTMGTLAGPVAENAGLDESLNIVALERPAQTGTRVAAFFVGKFEVTAAQHAAVTGESPAFWGVAMFREAQEAVRQRQEQGMESGAEGHNRALERAATHGMPVDSVTWEEASAMAARLGARLPMEAEWEYAARGGTSSAWSCAPTEAEIRRHANLADCKDKDIVLRVTDEPMLDFTASDGVGPPAPVGCFAANPFGLHDVHGNVQEWCAEPLRPYGEAAVGDPKSRVVRGGSHQSAIQVSRSAARQEARAGAAAQDLGFRLARDVVTAAAR